MHADVCDPEDEVAVARFRHTLRRLGAQLLKKDWGLGVDMLSFDIEGQVLTAFCDTWSLDIEGPDELVRRFLEELSREPSSAGDSETGGVRR